jgi:hypothetical protein
VFIAKFYAAANGAGRQFILEIGGFEASIEMLR